MEKTEVKYFCDICGEETKDYEIQELKLELEKSKLVRHHIFLDVCEECFLNNIAPLIKRIAEVKKWEFKLVGSFEQGGYSCPVCRHCNNAYFFDGVCSKCGFEQKDKSKFK